MTDGPGSQEILFVDDFSHNNNDLHWDHIKFDHAIQIDEIRILPDNCHIELKNGDVHRGTTTPSKFRVDFFSNNLHKTDLENSCLDKLGSLSYEENCGDTLSVKVTSFPTDWLLIVGSFKCLSIVVIGKKMQKSSPALVQSSSTSISQSLNGNSAGIPSTVNGKFPSLIRHHQRHHPYTKQIAQAARIATEEIKIETEAEAEDNMNEMSELPIVKFYLNLDESKDEINIVDLNEIRQEHSDLRFDPLAFRLSHKLEKKIPKLDGLNFDLAFLIENLSQDKLDYLSSFKNQMHQILKSRDLKEHNLIFKLCKNLHSKYPRFLIDQQLELSALIVDLMCVHVQQGFSFQLFKLVNWLNMVLNSAKSIEIFVHTSYQKMLKQLELVDSMSSRLTSATGRLLLKIQFNKNLDRLDSMCTSKTDSSVFDLEQAKCVYESIVAYVQQHLLTNDSLLFPIEPIFSNKNSLNKEIFNFFDEKNFFKNTIYIWSMKDNLFNCLIDRFMGEFFLPNGLNAYSFEAIQYLYKNEQLFNLYMESCGHESSVACELSYSVHLVELFEGFMERFGALKKTCRAGHVEPQFAVVDSIQEINFVLVEKADFVTNMLSRPDGNFNNKYFRCLVEFFEYLIEDNLDSSLRCYAMNSLTNILSGLCSKNVNWSVAAAKDYTLLTKLYKFSSHLINNLIMTSLKPSGERNQSYFKLIDKLKLIISVLEPFFNFKEGDKNFLNYTIDSFREQIDKNLSQYLAKYVQNPVQALNYLNGNITQMILMRNVLGPARRQSDKFAKKIMLGNLINRNLCHLLTNFLSRLNDYVIYYRNGCDLKKSTKLSILIETSVWLIKTIVLNLFKVQQAKFDDFYVLEILLELMPNLSHVTKQADSIGANLTQIFLVYFKFRQKKMLDTLARFVLKKPQNQAVGLAVFDACLSQSHTAHVHLSKSLFKENNHKYLIEENAPKGSSCVRMIKLMCLSVELRPAFLAICKKLASKDFIKIFLDYLIELIGEIKLNFSLNEVESFRKQDVAPKDDYLYEVELPPVEQTNCQPLTQINLNEYKIFLVKKFVFVAKFMVHLANQIDKSLLLDLFECQSVVSTDCLMNSNPDYGQLVPGLLHYFNQIDFNVKNSLAVHELCRIQEAILDLSYLFIGHLDESLLSKVLVDHLGMSRLTHPLVDIKCLRCLTTLPNKQQIVDCHFSNLAHLIHFINELADKINDMTFDQAVDMMNSFYGYMKVLIVAVMERDGRGSLWKLFEWSEKNSNDSLIDSISMSSSSFNGGSLMHCIINLEKNLDIFYSKLKDNEFEKKKFKSILNQSNCFIKYLNGLDDRILACFGDANVQTECVDEPEQMVDLDLEMNNQSEQILMLDKELYKKLKSNSDELAFQCQLPALEEICVERFAKSKSPDMINTRTGIRYKAPMRGGHTNSTPRPMSNLANSTSVPVISHLAPANSGLARTDSFRTRPQNTSRPPSLHVDDFYRIEQQQKQLNNSTNECQMANDLNDSNYDQLTVKINETFDSKNLSASSPQVKNLNSSSSNMKSGLINTNQQGSAQFINQPLVKIQSLQSNQYNLNQM